MRNYGLTKKVAQTLFPQAGSYLMPTLDLLRETLSKKGILTREVLIFCIATLAAENPNLKCTREQGSENYFWQTYGDTLGKYDASGFPKWGGRGFPQLTGEENYKLMAKLLGRPEILTNPDCILEPNLSMEVFCEFINHPYYLDHLYVEARRRYNGGNNGMAEFLEAVELAERSLAA